MSILSVAGTSKIICTSAVTGATRTYVSPICEPNILQHIFSHVKALGQSQSKSSFPRIGREAMIG